MVATWNPAANAGYYAKQTAYYTEGAGGEPDGVWYSPLGSFGLTDASSVEASVFERLFAGLGADCLPLISNGGGRLDRVPAFDVTLSAPRSVTLLWALGDTETRRLIESAQATAARQTLAMLEREASFARRGHGGGRIEHVPLTAAMFQHGESRPAEHDDGEVFADPNLHTHCVVLNLAERGDGSIGAIHSKVLRDWKMAAGATYHAALAAEMQVLGFGIDRIWKNGTFEIAGVDSRVIAYFSARRAEIEAELLDAGTTSAGNAALAAKVAKASRSAKGIGPKRREDVWRRAAGRLGIDPATFVADVRAAGLEAEPPIKDVSLSNRLDDLCSTFTTTRSVLDRRDVVRSVADALVGTGYGAAHIAVEADRLLADGQLVELGTDVIGQKRYSTPEMVRIERDVVEMAARLAASTDHQVVRDDVERRCRAHGLSLEQAAAAIEATGTARLAIVEGAPGTGKTTLLAPVVEAWQAAGYQVIGAATAWRVANALRDDLGIEARATASWIARADLDAPFLDRRTVLVVDEAGLLSSREMRQVLTAVERVGAKVLLVGDRGQLQAIGAGSGLALAARAVEAAKVETIVRQHEVWARDAVTAFGNGDPVSALPAYVARDLLIEADGKHAAVRAVVDRAEADRVLGGGESDAREATLVLTKTNAEAMAVGAEMRERLRQRSALSAHEVEIDAATPSGHAVSLPLAVGDRIRFLTRHDGIGVINGTVGLVTSVSPAAAEVTETASDVRHAIIEARVGNRVVRFDTADLANDRGRARIAWAYASTIYGAQGATVDRTVVLLTPAFDRHDIYVAASRARDETVLVVDRLAIDREIAPKGISKAGSAPSPDAGDRLKWMASRLSRSHVKETTADVAPALFAFMPRDDRHTGTPAVPAAHHAGHEQVPTSLGGRSAMQSAWEADLDL